MYKVGLTGGIGSGKSTVAKIFVSFGITLIDLDQLSRDVVSPDQPALEQIKNQFGSEILQEDGQLDRAKLRQRIFSDVGNSHDKEWLESLLHPLIRERQNQLIEAANSPYVIIEIPLLTENQLAGGVDRVLVVDTPEQTQIARTMARDAVQQDTVEHIMEAQATRQERLSVADDILVNDGTVEELKQKTQALHERYLVLAKKPEKES